MSIQIFGPLELRACQFFVGNGFVVIRIRAGDIGTANTQQQLALLHRIAQARANIHDAA